MKQYTSSIGNTTYLVREEEGVAINLSNNTPISIEEFFKMIKKKSSEFSNEWINTGTDDNLDNYITDNTINFNVEIDYTNQSQQLIKSSYDVVIGVDSNGEPFIARDIVGRTNVTTMEDLNLINDGKGNEGFITLKTGYDNSILWYAYHYGGMDTLNEVADLLGFTNLHDVYTHKENPNLVIKKSMTDDVIFWFDKIIYTDQTATIKKRKSRF